MSEDWVQDSGLGLSTEGHIDYISISTTECWLCEKGHYFRQRAPKQRQQRPGLPRDGSLEGERKQAIPRWPEEITVWVCTPVTSGQSICHSLSMILRNIFCFINKINDVEG